jgi:hypothetical protein
MLLRRSRNGGPLQLWCVELVPKKWRTDQAELRQVLWLARGMPKDEMQALMWMAQVLAGVQDHRERQFARVYQRLVVFTDRKEAARHARKETNEYWTGKVRRVRAVEATCRSNAR